MWRTTQLAWFEGCETVVERMWNGCGTVVERLWNGCGTVVERLWNGCGTVVERLWNGCGTGVERLWNGCGTVQPAPKVSMSSLRISAKRARLPGCCCCCSICCAFSSASHDMVSKKSSLMQGPSRQSRARSICALEPSPPQLSVPEGPHRFGGESGFLRTLVDRVLIGC